MWKLGLLAVSLGAALLWISSPAVGSIPQDPPQMWGDDFCCTPPTFGTPDEGTYGECSTDGPCWDDVATCQSAADAGTVPGGEITGVFCQMREDDFCNRRFPAIEESAPAYKCTIDTAGCDPGQATCFWEAAFWDPDENDSNSYAWGCNSDSSICPDEGD